MRIVSIVMDIKLFMQDRVAKDRQKNNHYLPMLELSFGIDVF